MIFPKDKGFKHEAYGAGDVQALLKTQEVRDQKQTKLPDVTAEDNGKVLSVVDGNWDKAQPTNELPDVTEDDNNKVLTVVNGAWNKAEVPSGGGNVEVFLINIEKYTPAHGPSYNRAILQNDKTNKDIDEAFLANKIIFLMVNENSSTDIDEQLSYFMYTQFDGTSNYIFTNFSMSPNVDGSSLFPTVTYIKIPLYDPEDGSETKVGKVNGPIQLALYSDIPTA